MRRIFGYMTDAHKKKLDPESRGRNVKLPLLRVRRRGPSDRRGDPARYNVMERDGVGRPIVHQNSPSTSLRSSPFFIRAAFFLRASERVSSGRRRIGRYDPLEDRRVLVGSQDFTFRGT